MEIAANRMINGFWDYARKWHQGFVKGLKLFRSNFDNEALQEQSLTCFSADMLKNTYTERNTNTNVLFQSRQSQRPHTYLEYHFWQLSSSILCDIQGFLTVNLRFVKFCQELICKIGFIWFPKPKFTEKSLEQLEKTFNVTQTKMTTEKIPMARCHGKDVTQSRHRIWNGMKEMLKWNLFPHWFTVWLYRLCILPVRNNIHRRGVPFSKVSKVLVVT